MWTSSYNEIIPNIQSPYTNRFKIPFLAMRQGEDDYVILRPGDTIANIAFKAHLSVGEMYNKVIYFYANSDTFIFDVGPQNMLTLPILYMIKEAQKYVEHIAENQKPLPKYIPNDAMEEVDAIDANDALDANGPDENYFSNYGDDVDYADDAKSKTFCLILEPFFFLHIILRQRDIWPPFTLSLTTTRKLSMNRI